MAANQQRETPIPPEDIPLPPPLRDLVDVQKNQKPKVPVTERHPGLQLDKYIHPCSNQERQKQELGNVIKASHGFGHAHGAPLLKELRPRRAATLAATGATAWTRATAGPLTLGLARASALENAGLTLHAIYGFPYLPGSGLKGLARSYAETVWLAGQDDPIADWATIEEVFGWAPGSDQVGSGKEKPWKPTGVPPHRKDNSARAGAVVFHDAWPTSWPQLFIDIVNNHHPSYYQKDGLPGDWDSPVPVYFLAIAPGQEFEFALGPGPALSDDRDAPIELARQWLDGALTHLGGGAKTAAGYGYWREPENDENTAAIRAVWERSRKAASDSSYEGPGVPRLDAEVRLELISPAFLAGADQQADDCDLRPATLRGLLRWWWRTMHVGFLERNDLAALEAALWGDTKQGGAIQTILGPAENKHVNKYNYRSKKEDERFKPDPQFARDHDLLQPKQNKTTQGLFYVSYGMNDDKKNEPRHHLEPGATWPLRIIARHARLSIKAREMMRLIPPSDVREQALTALWLLTTFGGVGSKARKGFGSLQQVEMSEDRNRWEEMTLEHCKILAAEFRARHGLSNQYARKRAQTAHLQDVLVVAPIASPWTDPWTVLDRVGYAYQDFAQRFKNDEDRDEVLVPTWSRTTGNGYTKASLGLPRKIHGPRDDRPLKGQHNWRPPLWLQSNGQEPTDRQSKDTRYASPVHLHLFRTDDGAICVRTIAFPVSDLPSLESGTKFLQEFLINFRKTLVDLCAEDTGSAGVRPTRQPTQSPPRRSGPIKRDADTPVRVTVLGPNAKGTGYRVQEEGKPEGSLTLGPPPQHPPSEGDVVAVEVHDDDPKNPQYHWPDPNAANRKKKGPGSKKRDLGPRR